MVDSNLIILGALAAGGYWFVYYGPSAGDVAGTLVETAGEMLVDGAVAAGDVAISTMGDAGMALAQLTHPQPLSDENVAIIMNKYKDVCYEKGETCAVGSSCNRCCNGWEWVNWKTKCKGTESEEKKEAAEAKKAVSAAIKKTCKKKDEYCLVGSTCNQCCNSWDWWSSGAYCN